MTGVKAQAEALLNGITPGEWRTYAHIDGTALYSARTPQPHEHFAEDEEPVHLIAENMGSVDAELCRNAPTLARQVVELAEEVARLHNRVRMLEYDNDGHLEMLGELHGELPDGATKETLGRLLRDWGTASDQSAYVPRAVLTEVHKELAAAVEALDTSSALVRQHVHAAFDRAALATQEPRHDD